MKITFDKDAKVSIYMPCFDVTRNELDIALRKVIAEMVDKDMNAGSITLKIDISTEKHVVEDENAQTGIRPAMSIEIGSKVAYVLQSKSEAKVDVITRGNQKELVLDDDSVFYIVSRDEASGQLSMFNNWDEYKNAIEEGE